MKTKERPRQQQWVGDPTSAWQRTALATDARAAIRDGWPGWIDNNIKLTIAKHCDDTFYPGTTWFAINSSFPVPICQRSRRSTTGGWNQVIQLTDGWAAGLSWTQTERPRSNQSWANSWGLWKWKKKTCPKFLSWELSKLDRGSLWVSRMTINTQR